MIDRFSPNATISTLFETIYSVPKPVRWLPGFVWPRLREWHAAFQMFVIAATLPPVLRDRLGLTWTSRQQRRFDRLRVIVRAAAALIPPSLRSVHLRAVARLNVWYRARHNLS
jgi:uncharacterized protein (DUF2236 family)